MIILPKLLRHLTSQIHPRRWLSAWMRVHYLVSIATVNVALLVLMSVPFAEPLAQPLLPVVAIPYFGLYARDLRLAGYRVRDLGHVYALNLLLTPVNMGGVLKSLQQAITRRRIPFGRTPKVSTRTPAPALYVLATFALLLLWTAGVAFDMAASRWSHAALAAINLAVLGYAVSRYVGWRNCVGDLRLAVNERLRPPMPSVAPKHRLDPAMRHKAVQHDNQPHRPSRSPAVVEQLRPREDTTLTPYDATEQDLTDLERLLSWLRYPGEKAAG